MSRFLSSPLVVGTMLLLLFGAARAFQLSPVTPLLRLHTSSTQHNNNSALYAGSSQEKDSDYMRWARASRSASADDNVVELLRPLGLVLNQDDNGNVYVETVAPRGNAARTGKVRCSKALDYSEEEAWWFTVRLTCQHVTHCSILEIHKYLGQGG